MQSTELEAEPPLALEERLAKIAEYRSFVSDTLTARLRELSEIIRKTRSDIDDLSSFIVTIETLRAADPESGGDSLVDLGGDGAMRVLCKAHVPSFGKLFVSIGMGFSVEMTLDEAVRFALQRRSLLQSLMDKQIDAAATVRADAEAAHQAIRQLSFDGV